MKTATRERYGARIERAVRWLTRHLDVDIDLHRLAEEAALSPYHFHRVYRAHMGETVQQTLSRLRLHRAAGRLLEGSRAIAGIATEAGFGSVQAFNHAFRTAYGMPPAAFRGRRLVQFPELSSLNRQEHTMYSIRIENRPALPVVALAHQGDYQEIGHGFKRLTAWAGGKGLLGPQTSAFGIYYDDPESVSLDKLRADACITVPSGFTPEGDYRLTQTPGGRCAVLEFVGPYAELNKAYAWLYSEWLPASGEEPGNAPPFEEYHNECADVPPAQLRTAICIPLAG